MTNTPAGQPTATDDVETAMRRSLMTPSDYVMKSLKEADGRDGVMWSGTIYKGTRKVATVSNDGRGGCHDFRYVDAAAREEFAAEARSRYPQVRFEVEDQWADDLAVIAKFNRARSPIVITNTMQVAYGEHAVYPARAPMQVVKDILTDPNGKFAGKDPHIWDRAQSVFVPAADFTPA